MKRLGCGVVSLQFKEILRSVMGSLTGRALGALCLKEKPELLRAMSTGDEKRKEELEVLAKHNRDERDRMGLTGPNVFIKTLMQE